MARLHNVRSRYHLSHLTRKHRLLITGFAPLFPRPMNIRIAAAALGLAAVLGVSLPASTPLMPVSEIRPGMTGIGRTVFTGTDLQEFKVHILGVLRNIQGPKRDLMLARLEGAGLDQ